jgi:hypothetical protein
VRSSNRTRCARRRFEVWAVFRFAHTRPSAVTGVIEVLGWFGSLLVLVALFFISAELLPAVSVTYRVLNITGSALLACYAALHQAYAFMFTKVAWLAVMISAIICVRRRYHAKFSEPD